MKKKILAFRNPECNYDVGTLYELIADLLTEWKINESVLLIFAGVGSPNHHMVRDLTSRLSVQSHFSIGICVIYLVKHKFSIFLFKMDFMG